MSKNLGLGGYLILTEVAKQLGVKPAAISYLFNQRLLDTNVCQLIGMRRYIPVAYVAVIRKQLANKNTLHPPIGRPSKRSDGMAKVKAAARRLMDHAKSGETYCIPIPGLPGLFWTEDADTKTVCEFVLTLQLPK